MSQAPLPSSIYSLFMNSALLAFEAQQVIGLRMLRLAAGGAPATREFQRMLVEKVHAAAEIGGTAAAAIVTGKNGAAVAQGVIRGYRTRVGKNRRRLK